MLREPVRFDETPNVDPETLVIVPEATMLTSGIETSEVWFVGKETSITPAVRLTGRSWADAALESDAKARIAK